MVPIALKDHSAFILMVKDSMKLLVLLAFMTFGTTNPATKCYVSEDLFILKVCLELLLVGNIA